MLVKISGMVLNGTMSTTQYINAVFKSKPVGERYQREYTNHYGPSLSGHSLHTKASLSSKATNLYHYYY